MLVLQINSSPGEDNCLWRWSRRERSSNRFQCRCRRWRALVFLKNSLFFLFQWSICSTLANTRHCERQMLTAVWGSWQEGPSSGELSTFDPFNLIDQKLPNFVKLLICDYIQLVCIAIPRDFEDRSVPKGLINDLGAFWPGTEEK